MADVTVKRVYEQIIRLRGLAPELVTLTDAERGVLGDRMSERMCEAWEAEFWPDLMRVVRRQYRLSYDATLNYSTGDEVYAEDADGLGAYYASVLDSNTDNDPATDDGTNWAAVGDDFLASIDFVEEGFETIGGVDPEHSVYDKDPRLSPDLRPYVNARIYGEQILLTGSAKPLRPWVEFRPPAPELSMVPWASGTDYAIADVVYLEGTGYCYRALLPSTGQQPDQNTNAWREVGVPKWLVPFVVHGVASDELHDDEARKAGEARAYRELELAKDRRLRQRTRRRVRVRR